MARCYQPDGTYTFSAPGEPCPGEFVSPAVRAFNLARAQEQLSRTGGLDQIYALQGAGVPTELFFGFPDSAGLLSGGSLAQAAKTVDPGYVDPLEELRAVLGILVLLVVLTRLG